MHEERGVGLILIDRELRPIYANTESLRILSFPHAGHGEVTTPTAVMQRRLRLILGTDRCRSESLLPVEFLSGRRRYLCRSVYLHRCPGDGGDAPVALLLERQDHIWSTAIFEASRRFRLSERETETVQHLAHGLTTKEIASRMHISPNTVKQFVRLIMTKMGVATRVGVLGRIFPS